VTEHGSEKSQFIQQLRDLAPSFGLSLPDSVIEKFVLHFEFLMRWNRKVNLTAIVQPSEATRFHYLESLFATKVLRADIKRIADIGSGAGFPGLPVAIFRPDLHLTLIEKNQRKVVFLSEVVRVLDLDNVSVFAGRFEEFDASWIDCIVGRAIERFSENVEKLLVMANHCRQVVFFCNGTLATEIERIASLFWRIGRLQIPLSNDRIILHLSK
jgi:16S rRNA (guanine527-N7)-methyltransferase